MTDHRLRTCQGCQYRIEGLGAGTGADDHAKQLIQGRSRVEGDNDRVA